MARMYIRKTVKFTIFEIKVKEGIDTGVGYCVVVTDIKGKWQVNAVETTNMKDPRQKMMALKSFIKKMELFARKKGATVKFGGRTQIRQIAKKQGAKIEYIKTRYIGKVRVKVPIKQKKKIQKKPKRKIKKYKKKRK